MNTCAFTGHRSQKLKFLNKPNDERCMRLKERLNEAVEYVISCNGVTKFLSGMALGVDMLAAEVVLELRESNPQLTLECVLPCADQSIKWSKKERDRYEKILSLCDKIVTLQEAYTSDCMQKRNRYMVDKADIIIAVWDKHINGGTAKTVEYARSINKPVIIIDPIKIEIQYNNVSSI